MRRKAKAYAEPSNLGDAQAAMPARCNQTWAMLIKQVYEIDPMVCPRCGGAMTVVSFIEPPQCDVIEKILPHCRLWQARATPEIEDLVLEPRCCLLGQLYGFLGPS